MNPGTGVFIAAGSNIEPERHLACAARELYEVFGRGRFSPWYRNRAADVAGGDFINFVAGFTTDAGVYEVLRQLHAIEARCGRIRELPKSTPPPIDLDLLLYGDRVCEEPGLKLPRPELLTRAYLLGPLADIAPDVMHPTAGVTIRELWGCFDRRVHPLSRIDSPPL